MVSRLTVTAVLTMSMGAFSIVTSLRLLLCTVSSSCFGLCAGCMLARKDEGASDVRYWALGIAVGLLRKVAVTLLR